MQRINRFACVALAILPFAAAAQQSQQTSDPTDASVVVPASRYESVFLSYRPAIEEEASPDKIWRNVNDEMKALGGHVGHVKAASSPASSAPAQQDKHH